MKYPHGIACNILKKNHFFKINNLLPFLIIVYCFCSTTAYDHTLDGAFIMFHVPNNVGQDTERESVIFL